MKKHILFFQFFFFIVTSINGNYCFGNSSDTIPPQHEITLREAHIGSLQIDTLLLDSYGLLPENIRTFYKSARHVFEENPEADFSDKAIIELAQKYSIPVMGGPMLGNLNENGLTIWMRPVSRDPILVKLTAFGGSEEKSFVIKPEKPGVEQRLIVEGLVPDTKYTYAVYSQNNKIAAGKFTTAPPTDARSIFTLTFGSCFHKIGLHNPNLIHQILKREPHAMLLLGDIAVDDRRNHVNMHRSDYLLRDVSKPWSELAANVPLYTSWDDHDYFDDDLGGIPKGFTEDDRIAVTEVWHQNWNNPENLNPGIYFNTRIGPVEVIMLDTRSLREIERRGEYGSYLGIEQLNWLKETLKKSDAPFKVISSGTMWSDYISDGKDSWGTWDQEGREELYDFIEVENIQGVLLVSGDRHGSRGFTIPRPFRICVT
jgi:alkaline phosphatase D